ncbi:MAG: hypothetical protein ABIH55_02140 [Nanoarchaeota archaeon]|nr:hypothetical protein [Nanoarchaeota archaeon]MBU1134974.1 hypothetical protein [Nanoarchaeota archaeon]
MGKLFLSKAEAKKAPEIKGKNGQKTLLAILCIVAVIYAIVGTVLSQGETLLSAVLIFIIFGLFGGQLLVKRNIFKWQYTLLLIFSVWVILANSFWTIPYMFDLIYEGWMPTILLEPLIANFGFLAIAVLCYNIALRGVPINKWFSTK